MRFRFCGGADAPDWVIASAAVLSRLSSVRMRLLCKQVVNRHLDAPISFEKIQRLTTGERLRFDAEEVQEMISAVDFVISNATKFDIPAAELSEDLLQLGLPLDVGRAIVRNYELYHDRLREALRSSTLSFPGIKDIRWRVDLTLASSSMSLEPSARLGLVTTESKGLAFDMNPDQLTVFLHELKSARAVLDSVPS